MIKALVSCLLAVAALVAGANTSEAAGFQFVEQHFVDGRPLFGVQYRVFSGDPVTFQSVCFTAVGGGTSIRFHSLGGPDRPLGAACNSVDLSGLFVVLVADIPVGPYSITLIASVNGTGEETARFTFGGVVNPPPPPPLPRSLRVRAALWTAEGNGPFEPAAGAALPANAVVPLGALLTVQAIDQDGSPLISTFTLAEQSPDPSVDSNALFPGLTLHQYVSAQPDQAILQAVHKGSVKIVVTPSDSSIPGERLTVIVGSPQSLGTSGASVDDDVVETAHRTGVPPHFIKAHVWKESFPKWNRSTYRYEPIGPAGDLQAVSRAQNLRTRVPYTQYRLATVADSLNNPGLAQGPLVTNLDRDARQALHVGCNSSGINGTPIGAVALAVNPTAWEIFRCNDTTGGKMNWTTNAGGVQRAQARVTQLGADPFTAQTSLAASFGLLQMTFTRVVSEKKWPGIAGRINPSLLFDTTGNIAAEGGSLRVGTRSLRDAVLKRHAPFNPSTPDQLLQAFVVSWKRDYNNGEPNYGAIIGLMSEQFRPVPSGSVLQ